MPRIVRHKFIQNDDGATALEFGIVAPVLFLLIIGIMEFGLILFASNVIENATAVGARFGITGSDYNSGDRADFIVDEIERTAGGLLDSGSLSVVCTPLGTDVPDLAGVSPAPPRCLNASVDDCGPGAGGQVVLYSVDYCWDIVTPLIGEFFTNNIYPIQSSLLVRNEDF